MRSRQNWRKFKEFHRTWPVIFNNIFSLLPPSPTFCCSQMLRGWQGENSLASLWQGMRATLSQGVKGVSPLAPPVDTRKDKTCSAHLYGTPCAGASTRPSHRAVSSRYLSTYLSFESVKIRKGSKITFARNKRTEVEEKPWAPFLNLFLTIDRLIKYHSHQEPSLSSTTFSSVSFTSLSFYTNLHFLRSCMQQTTRNYAGNVA